MVDTAVGAVPQMALVVSRISLISIHDPNSPATSGVFLCLVGAVTKITATDDCGHCLIY